jgi:anti-anti-sigma factor
MTGDASQREPSQASEHVLAPGELTIGSQRVGDVHTIRLFGELDLANADRIEQELLRVEATDAGSIVLDLAGLTFMDSNGVQLVTRAAARSRENSDRLTLRRGPHAVHRVLELCGLAEHLPFAD